MGAFTGPGEVASISFAPDGRQVAIGKHNARVQESASDQGVSVWTILEDRKAVAPHETRQPAEPARRSHVSP